MNVTPSQEAALRIAEQMIDHGIPIFAAAPCLGALCGRKGHETGKHQYDLPPKWQLTVPSRVWLEKWQPGWALGAVGGHVADFLDEDPRHGGAASIEELIGAGQMPRVFGVQNTPSGGRHYVISPLHERETNAFMPGLDYQGGLPDGKGRAFVWIAPTVKRAKVPPYADAAYEWVQVPDLDYLKDFDCDDSIEGLRTRILARKVRTAGNEPDRSGLEKRAFTEEEAQRFCSITLERLQTAEIGGIETAANSAAVQLSHFVPEFWTEEFAYAVLTSALSETAYDPEHPGSAWTAEKFHDVLAGVNGRSPADWEAIRKPESVSEVIPPGDAVDALLAEMRKPSEIKKQQPPRALIRGLLNLDSESWIIGAPGSKKSFVATDMAGHVALGIPWQGMKVHQGRVVMIVAEGAGGLGPRLAAWEAEHGRAMSEDIDILPRPVQAADLEKWAVLIEACRRIGPALVVLDTQARVTVGLEENSAKEMGIFIEAVRAIREATGACVLTVHHTGRAGGDARGSSAIDGAQHSELKVVAEKGSLRGKLVSEKQKDMALADDVELVFAVHEVGADDDGEPITSLALVSDTFRKLAGTTTERPEDPAGSVRIQEPQDWVADLVPGTTGMDMFKRQLIQTLADQTHLGDGRTESQIRASMTERWYAERSASGRTKKGIDNQTWHRAWGWIEALEVDGAGEPIMIKTGRYFKINALINPVTGQ